MAQFVVDSEVITGKTSEARGYMERIATEVNGLTTSLQELQSTWTGTASARFQEVLSNWRQTQARVEESMGQINQALASAGTNYAETEAANASMFAG
ncbi:MULTISPECIES: WXG100 family type VII secretion target [Kocuria]|uniref:WXG100 family type VII secretion target n=1 Tax=Kocuria TaxID=57493 RepID=UPI0006613C25|nr:MULTISPECIES: WXG100 family type VII secretion target [Kocuria]MCT1366404.1 WXG100 family type VII secretion target [Rothia sp. p3-SID1597]RUQ21302.1 WXG100 family type VII secretion target [Kocuria sp. HSID16901]